jgi:hypothetical protein
MPDEMIVNLLKTAAAFALPLFSCRHMFCSLAVQSGFAVWTSLVTS